MKLIAIVQLLIATICKTLVCSLRIILIVSIEKLLLVVAYIIMRMC